jgi:antitoxin ChpS
LGDEADRAITIGGRWLSDLLEAMRQLLWGSPGMVFECYTEVGFIMGVGMLQTLRKAGGSLVMTVPKAFIDQNDLMEGSQVELRLSGKKMTVETRARPRYKLADLMAEMPEGLPRAAGWDEMPAVGLEHG